MRIILEHMEKERVFFLVSHTNGNGADNNGKWTNKKHFTTNNGFYFLLNAITAYDVIVDDR